MPSDSSSSNGATLDLIDMSRFAGHANAVAAVARQIDHACRTLGFFRLVGHGVDRRLLSELDAQARAFFALPRETKAAIAMSHGGRSWRGWFDLGTELTSSIPDRKEGLYFGTEHPADHPRVVAGTPLHGPNQFPEGEFGPAVLAWLDAMRPVADSVLRAIAIGLGIDAHWFAQNLTYDPTVLFRIFQYPTLPDNLTTDQWGVGEHTDYGLITLLAQDHAGGLQVKTPDGQWIDVEPQPADPDDEIVLIVNIGDMLDRLTEGRYRSTPHRVRNISGRNRLSFPYFFDPSWDATVRALPLPGARPPDDRSRRWDSNSVHDGEPLYGDYLTAKVARVFPHLFELDQDL